MIGEVVNECSIYVPALARSGPISPPTWITILIIRPSSKSIYMVAVPLVNLREALKKMGKSTKNIGKATGGREGASPRKRGVTIVDVAREANVGRMTVSRYFSEPHRVSPEMKKRIEKVVKRLGYAPSPAARALASKRSNFVGVVIPSVTNFVFSDVLKGIYSAELSNDHQIQFGNAHYNPREEEALIRNFLLQNPTGIITTGADQTTECRELLRQANCRVVQIMEYTEDPIDMVVGLDHYQATLAGIQHLYDSGYKKPGFLAGRSFHGGIMEPRISQRLEAFKHITSKNGGFDESHVLHTGEPSSANVGRSLMSDLLDRCPEVDSVFCNNDDIALGALFECQRRGVNVPNEIGICGFNDFEISSVTFPTLTSVCSNRFKMGKLAMEMLMRASEGEEIERPSVDLGFQVVERESTQRK